MVIQMHPIAEVAHYVSYYYNTRKHPFKGKSEKFQENSDLNFNFLQLNHKYGLKTQVYPHERVKNKIAFTLYHIHTKIPLNACSLQCTLSERRSYTAHRAGVVVRRSASLTRLELGSNLAWMLCCDYGMGGPWPWGYACWFLFGGGDGCIDVRCSDQGSASSLPFRFSCISHHASLSLPDLPTNSSL